MGSVEEHYDNVLGEVYTWMFGGFESGKQKNIEFFKKHNIAPKGSGIAFDLGAGSGFQTIPLAEFGFSVTAIDFSEYLLSELVQNSKELSIETVQDNLLNFQKYRNSGIELIVCMTDTLIHLRSKEEILSLFEKSYNSLENEGKLILTFRDMTQELSGTDRFIPVKSDSNIIFTCFLEYDPEVVNVHDIVYKKTDDKWVLYKSSYKKLRISKEWVKNKLSDVGYSVHEKESENGFVTLIASKEET